MKIVWTIVALLLLAGLVVLFQPEARVEPSGGAWPGASDAVSTPRPADPPAPPPPSPAATETPSAPRVLAPSQPAEASASAEPLFSTKADRPAATPARVPSAEPARPAGSGGSTLDAFEPVVPAIPEAEILPSVFRRLPDGAISVDDAWTVRGDGSAERPYEVSWEYLASAQEDYAPRLGERKLPARIAFLSGKHVRISGYLAFPLVAPTASECLVMLNQWDGCCIGIPPTPYDAIEVKLAGAIKGWQRHSINFGAVEGLFKVEPYLVENWLVGLYLLEGAKIDTEL
jgi:hypothetical protein